MRGRRFPWIGLLLALAGAVTVTAAASDKDAATSTGRVVGVPSGDTLLVRVGNAQKATRVRIIGVRAPAGPDCYARKSAAHARALALGKRVRLVGDLDPGAHVSLPSGDDLGALLLRRGAAQIDVWRSPSARFASYVPVQREAQTSARGMWRACSADIEVSITGPDQGLPGEALTYRVAVRNKGPLTAQKAELRLRPGNYAEQLVSVTAPRGTCTPATWRASCTFVRLRPGEIAAVTVVLRPTKFGALSARAEVSLMGCTEARCGRAALLDPNLDGNHAATVTIVPGGGYERKCDQSYPAACIPVPPPDLDCEDFLPLEKFPVVHGIPNADDHHLDGNGNGVGCEEEDY